jgi:glycosyltransferase involved in cell wall biosynthesis
MAPGDELIVVDDGSTDSTAEALAPFADRIRYFRTENRGAGPARNHGIEQARHALIAFLDSDDEWMPGGLFLKRSVMSARPELVFCFTNFANTGEDGTTTRNYLVHWHHDTRDWDEILGPGQAFSSIAPLPPGSPDFQVHSGDMYPLLLQQPYVAAWTSIVRRTIAGSDFQFGNDFQTAEDWYCFGRIARRAPAAYLDCETAWNHGHSGPRLTSDAGAIGYLNGHLQLAQRIWGQDPAFLEGHEQLYTQVIASIHLKRARWYLSRGLTAAARADLAAAGTAAPRSLKLLAALPGPMLSIAGRMRRRAIGAAGRTR